MFTKLQNTLLTAYQGKKVKECDGKDFADLWTAIVMETGVKFKSEEEAKAESEMYFRALTARMSDHYIREIRAAYYYAFEGVLVDVKGESIELYRMLDFKQTKELVLAFREFFKKSFSEHFKNQTFYLENKKEHKITKEELIERLKVAVDRAIKSYKLTGDFNEYGTDLFIFNMLKDLDKNPITKERFELFKKEAESLEKIDMIKRKESAKTLGARIDIMSAIKSGPSEVSIINRAKGLAVKELIKDWVEFENTIEEILE